jgi:hypothetical protein
LASNFEWAGSVDPHAVAIACDPGPPILIARYTLDPRDPSGRVSLLLHVWVARLESEASQLFDELWLRSEYSSLKKSFLKADGRRIAGPERSFYAMGFERVWGGQIKRNGFSEDVVDKNRNQVRLRPNMPNGKSNLWSNISAGLAILCLGLASLAFYLYDQEGKITEALIAERNKSTETEAMLKNAKSDLERQGKRIADLEDEKVRLTVQSDDKDVKIGRLESEKESLKRELEVHNNPPDARDKTDFKAENVRLKYSLEKLEKELNLLRAAVAKAKGAFEEVFKLLPDQSKPSEGSKDQRELPLSSQNLNEGSVQIPINPRFLIEVLILGLEGFHLFDERRVREQ